jgi:hypothetical protein
MYDVTTIRVGLGSFGALNPEIAGLGSAETHPPVTARSTAPVAPIIPIVDRRMRTSSYFRDSEGLRERSVGWLGGGA